MTATDGGLHRLVVEVLCVGDRRRRRGGGKRKWHVCCMHGHALHGGGLGGGGRPAGDGQNWRQGAADVTTHEDVTNLQPLPRGIHLPN